EQEVRKAESGGQALQHRALAQRDTAGLGGGGEHREVEHHHGAQLKEATAGASGGGEAHGQTAEKAAGEVVQLDGKEEDVKRQQQRKAEGQRAGGGKAQLFRLGPQGCAPGGVGGFSQRARRQP